MSDLGRLVEVKGRSEGSGFLIAEGLILTAWHLLRPPPGEPTPLRVRVRLQRDIKAGASVELADQFAERLWPDSDDPGEDFDFALLSIQGRLTQGSANYSSSSDRAVSWASLKRWGKVEVTAVGYPDVAIDHRLQRRDTLGVTGWIQPADNLRSLTEGRGALTMKILDEDTPDEPFAIAWPAMSGAAVFAGQVLIGIVRIAGESHSRHQLRVLPIDRLFTREDVLNILAKSGYPMLPRVDLEPLSIAIASVTQHSAGIEERPENEDESVFAEKFTLKFARELNLRMVPIIPILQAYYPDLLEGKLKGFKFQRKHIAFDYSTQYLELCALVKSDLLYLPARRHIERLEKMLSQAILLTLNIAYLHDKQNYLCFQSCFWISRAIRATILGTFQNAEIDISPLGELQDDGEDKVVLPSDPLNYFVLNRCYQSKMIKIDFWVPNDEARSTAAYLPESGTIGSWFSRRPLSPQPLKDFWNPNDLYNFVFPQMILRHLINGEGIIDNWEGFKVGAA